MMFPIIPNIEKKIIDQKWFTLNNYVNDNKEVTQLEDRHMDWLKFIWSKYSDIRPIGKLNDNNAEDDEDEDDDTEGVEDDDDDDNDDDNDDDDGASTSEDYDEEESEVDIETAAYDRTLPFGL